MSKKKNKKHKPEQPEAPDFNRKDLRQVLTKLFGDHRAKTYNFKEISKIIEAGQGGGGRKLLNEVLGELVREDFLLEISAGKFKFNEPSQIIEGRVDMTARGSAYIVPMAESESKDVFVSSENLKTAMHGDQVRIRLFASRKGQMQGEVVEIVKRARNTIVGTLKLSKGIAFLVPDNSKIPFDVLIPKDNLAGAKDGEKVVAKIVEWSPSGQNPTGTVTQVLGKAGLNETEIHAIMADFELPVAFPKEVEQVAEQVEPGITPEEVAKRRDFREVLTFTIDPWDAKDFDDALSLRKLENGNWEVGVHIADVTHYVKPRTLLDKEAYERATSVYLVDRVVPMLPEKLSNFVCSLRPDEEKLTFSAVFELDGQAQLKREWFGRTVIRSARRFSYEEAQQRIETGEGDLAQEILILNGLAKQLRADRMNNGSISFDRVEVRFKIDEQGKPLEVYFKESKDSNHLIEEFMLLANQRVASRIGKPGQNAKPKTFVYRIHDEPDPEKLSEFAGFVKRLGKNIRLGNTKEAAKAINKLLEEVKGTGEGDVISQMAIRSMAKAVYSTENIGHYGLGFEYYTHFTSPIRRYPDMMVHRLLATYLKGGKTASEEVYEDRCKHSSNMEQRAQKAERASIKYKQVEFMQEKLGQVFEATISGITDWGIYVEMVETKIEGMISIRDLDDDYYYFDEKNYKMVGHRTKRTLQMGEVMQVQLARVSLQKRQLDFVPYREANAKAGKKR